MLREHTWWLVKYFIFRSLRGTGGRRLDAKGKLEADNLPSKVVE